MNPVFLSLGILTLVLTAGCDNLPWSSKKQDAGNANAGLTTAQSAPTPAKPHALRSEKHPS